MTYDVKRTAWVDYDVAGGGGSGYELVAWPALQLLNVLVWLPHRMRGRGYTLHVHDESGRRPARERYRTRAEAEAVLAARRVIADRPPNEAVVAPAPPAGDVDGPFRRGSASNGSAPAVRGEQ